MNMDDGILLVPSLGGIAAALANETSAWPKPSSPRAAAWVEEGRGVGEGREGEGFGMLAARPSKPVHTGRTQQEGLRAPIVCSHLCD